MWSIRSSSPTAAALIARSSCAGGARVVSETRRAGTAGCAARRRGCGRLRHLWGFSTATAAIGPNRSRPRCWRRCSTFGTIASARATAAAGSAEHTSAHQIIAGYAAGFALRFLYRLYYTDMCPFRAIRREASARLGMRETVIWLKAGNADAGGSRRPAHTRHPCRPPPAGRWRLKGFRQPSVTIKASLRIGATLACIVCEGRR